MKFGLAAHKLHRNGPHSALLEWAELCGPHLKALDVQFECTGGAYYALTNRGQLSELVKNVGSGRNGGLIRLVSRAAGGLTLDSRINGMFFFIDPVDPTSLYPELHALKRQCIIHQIPFIATFAGAIEWVNVELISKNHLTMSHEKARRCADHQSQTIALIAHDTLKPSMIDFAAQHFDYLSLFSKRVGTGTTGQLLNEMAWSRGWPASEEWVTRYLSGPMGGDAQIAELVLDGECQKVIFFEDPHVARQHEADIQLLDRAVYSAGQTTTCMNTPAMAHRWATAFASLKQ